MPRGSDRIIYVAMILLLLYGLIMVGSASMGLSIGNNMALLINIGKQAAFMVVGYLAMAWITNRFTLSFLKSDSFIYMIVLTGILLLLCLAFKASYGAKAWIHLPLGKTLDVTLQPSEFAKVVAILTVAAHTGNVTKNVKNGFEILSRPIAIVGVYCFIVVVLQHDFGSASIIFLITCVCLLLPDHPKLKKFQQILAALFWVAVAFAVFILSPWGESLITRMTFLDDYQIKRFTAAINPFADQYDSGYHLINSLICFASGDWLGKGFGQSIRKYTEFPNANSDFIAAILVEELGFAGFLVLMALYSMILIRLFMHAWRIKNEQARIILIGSAMYLLIHMFFNIGGVTGLIPLTGVPLLLISAGGSSTLSFLACLGLCQAVISGEQRGEIK